MLNEVRIFELRIICSNSNSILKIRYSDPTCTKTGVGIEAWLSHNRLPTRHDVLVLCRPLPPATSPVHNWRGRRRRCWRLITPPRPHTSLLLPSRRAACPLSGCWSQRSLIGITRCVMKRILADTVAIGDPHWIDINEHNTPHKLSTYSGIFSFGILGIHLQLPNRLAGEALL